MSFDVFLQKFVRGEPAKANRESVRAVLSTQDFSGPDDFGFYDVRFTDGSEVEFSASGLSGESDFAACAFHIRGMSQRLVSFIWDIAKAGEMVILPAMDDFVPILSSLEQHNHLPQDLARDFPVPVVCKSPAELESLLVGGYSGWQRYRNQVIDGGT